MSKAASREAAIWLPLAFLNLLVGNVLIRGWPAGLAPDLAHPYLYSGDGLASAWWVDRVVNGCWIFHSDRSGYPFGSDVLDYPVSDGGSFVILKLLGALTGSTAATMNLYVLAGFAITFVAGYFAMRTLRIGRAFSAAGSTLFTLLPFHFIRLLELQHLFLGWYAVVPIFFTLAWRLYTGGAASRSVPSFMGSIVVSIALASFGLYYALFGMIVLVLGGVGGFVRHRATGTLAATLVAAASVIVGIGVNTAPNLAYLAEHGSNPAVAQRGLNESEIYGLKLVQMLLPRADHRIPAFGEPARRYDALAPLVNENASSALGIVGAAGLLLLFGSAFRRLAGSGSDERLSFLSLVALCAFAIGTIGGFSAVFATLVSPAIRGWNRISVFIAFSAFAATIIAIEHVLLRWTVRRWQATVTACGAGILAIGGTLDQTVPACASCVRSSAVEFDRDREFVAAIEKRVPNGAAIYQMPYQPFPEVPPLNHLGAFVLLVGAIHSTQLRWSFGTMKGREGDAFFRALAEEPLDAQLHVLRQLRFSGIYIDRRGYVDNGHAVEDRLRQLLDEQPSLVRSDGRVAFYDLAPTSPGLRPGLGASEVMKLAGFRADEFGVRYAATLAEGIDFRRPGLPRFVEDIRGLSDQEPWGRWSDARISPAIVLTFRDPLPASFTLAIRGRAFGPNVRRPIPIRIGNEQHFVILAENAGETRARFDMGSAQVRTIEIMPPSPTSPAELGLGNDRRKLGVGLERLWLASPDT
jgi:phosphoglycerol transferase